MVDPDPSKAADALGILRSGRERVSRESYRQELLMLGGRAVSTVLWMGRKDIRDPKLRRVCDVVVLLGTVGLGLWHYDQAKVQGLWTEQRERVKEASTRVARLREEGASEEELREQGRAVIEAMRPEVVEALALAVGTSVARRVVLRGCGGAGSATPTWRRAS